MTARLALVVLAFLSVLTPGLSRAHAAADEDVPARSASLTGEREFYVNGRLLVLRVELWRDFQPPSDEQGRPMRASVQIRTRMPGGLPRDLHATSIRVRLAGRNWFAALAQSDIAQGPYPAWRVYSAMNGPRWAPGSTVQCTVALRVGRRTLNITLPVVITRVE